MLSDVGPSARGRREISAALAATLTLALLTAHAAAGAGAPPTGEAPTAAHSGSVPTRAGVHRASSCLC